MMELLKNPIIKGIGIVLILYFALFANTQHPKSLGNRLSSENIKKNLSEVKNKGEFIASNVKIAKDLSKIATSNTKILSEDAKIGSGDFAVSCGDEAVISYEILTTDGKVLESFASEKVTVGSKNNIFLEKNIIGMKASGTRNINITNDTISQDKTISQRLNKSDSGSLRIKITLLSFAKSSATNLSCN